MRVWIAFALVLCVFTDSARAETRFMEDSDELLKIPVNVTGVLKAKPQDGWFVRTAYFKAIGDNASGDPGYYMYPLTAREQAKLSAAEGVYACYRRDKVNATKGKFQFGRYANGMRYARVARQQQLEKGLSKDQKTLVEAGKVVAAVVALYTGDPEAYVAGSEGWENLIGTVHSTTNFRRRLDMTPTVIHGKERWRAEGKFSITVKRYYNCWTAMRFQLNYKP
ncbi:MULTISPECIES: hypothetical protein [unclassified Sinorhizobium]|uniref:hypothetical protein n=1 Tax=unclassified Sinorhizobium TaxID=2613772 RepID=UPI0035267198